MILLRLLCLRLAGAFLLMTGLCSWAAAGGQVRLTDPSQTASELFWKGLYASGGNTLYCPQAFTRKSPRFTIEYVYSEIWIKRALNCLTLSECMAKDIYRRSMSDMHNMYPILRHLALAKREANFYDIKLSGPNVEVEPGCTFKLYGPDAEPEDSAKGNVARAIAYMVSEYGLRLMGPPLQYRRWNKIDPPDADEKKRNEQIARMQGNRNRFIDNPALLDTAL